MSSGKAIQPRRRADAHKLMSMLLEYEAAARENGIDFASSRFKELTLPRRNNYRAELVADYIKLSTHGVESADEQVESEVAQFCSKVCEMQVPSHELIGTYLAAQDIVSRNERLGENPAVQDALRQTIITVLRGCIDTLADRTENAAA